MRIRTVISVLAVAAVLMVSAPAFAQEKGAANVAFGYSNLTFFDPTDSLPAGWNANVGVGVSSNAAFVGEIGGHYESGVKLHTFQGGLRIASRTNPKTVPFFQVLTGLGRFSAGGFSSNAWTLSPGGGVDVQINEQASFRGQVDWVLMRSGGANSNAMRFGAGIVINMPKK